MGRFEAPPIDPNPEATGSAAADPVARESRDRAEQRNVLDPSPIEERGEEVEASRAPAAPPDADESVASFERARHSRGPIAFARLGLRIVALPSASGMLLAWYLAGRVVRPGGERAVLWRNRMIRVWGRTVARLMGARVTVEGTPPEGSLVVSNHLSYVDIPVLASALPTVFVSKAEVASWPLIGPLSRATGTIFVQRDRKRELPEAAARIRGELESGSGVVLFPEGTSGSGSELLTFRPSLLDPAARGGLPVAYAALTYRTPPGAPKASQTVCWWGDMAFGGHILELLRLPYFDAHVRFGSTTLSGADRKDLADRLWHAVQALFEPTE